MTLNISPPNFSGLSGGGGGGNLNLPVPGALGLQALQIRKAEEASKRSAMLEQMQLQQQGALGLGNQNIQRQQLQQQGNIARQAAQLEQQKMAQQGVQLTFDREKMAQQGDQLSQSLAQDGRRLDISEKGQNQAMELQMRKEMAKLMDDNDAKSIKEKGSFASYARISLDQASSPEEANQITNEFLKEAVSNKYLSAEQSKAFAQAPIQQRKNMLGSMIIQFGVADDHMRMNPPPKKESSGETEVILADGTVIRTGKLTTPNKTKYQADTVSADDNIKELKSIYDSVPKKFFGAAAVGQSATWAQEWAEKVPVIGEMLKPSAGDKKELENYSSIQSQTKNQAMNIIKNLSGLSYTDKQLEFMNSIVPNIGPGAVESEFKGKSSNLIRFFEQIKKDRQLLLSQGVVVGTPEYEEKMRSKVESAATSSGSDTFDKYRADPRYKDWSDDKIRRAIE